MIRVNNEPVVFSHFNDGTCIFNYLTQWDSNIMITWLYENDEELIQLIYLARHIREHLNPNRYMTLTMPYCPNARQDRVKKIDDVFTLKYFADIINSLKFDDILIYDPHSVVAEALFNNIRIIRPSYEIDIALEGSDMILFPDDGSMKRYRDYTFGHKFGYGVKVRNWETKEIESLKLIIEEESVKGKNFLIIDDICGSGQTIAKAALQLKELGANKINVWVSHCENTVMKPCIRYNGSYFSLLDIPGLINKFYTTNSILTESHPKIKIIREF